MWSSTLVVDSVIPNIISRSRKLTNLATGYRVIDCLFPISTGQRELVIGDRQTGKSVLCVSSVMQQVSKNYEVVSRKSVYGILCLVSQKCISVMRIYELLHRNHVDSFSVIMFAGVIDAVALQFIVPLSSTAVSEFFRNQGSHAFIIYDDLSKHAVSYRQLSLFLRKAVGREAYPSDIFYIHARLLERSCCLNYTFGGGSLSCLPVIETLSNDISAYIATNVISITDGQLYLDSVLFGLGVCPSVSIDKSVSRVGAKSLDSFWRSISFRLYAMINEYKQEVDAAVKSSLFKIRKHRWDRVHCIFTQRSPIYFFYNVLMVFVCLHGLADHVSLRFIKLLEYCLLSFDVVVVVGMGLMNYILLSTWCIYYVFRIIGFSLQTCLRLLVDRLYVGVYLFRFYIQRRLMKVSSWFAGLVKQLLGSVQYLTSIKWSSSMSLLCDPLQLIRFVCGSEKSDYSVNSDIGYLEIIMVWIMD